MSLANAKLRGVQFTREQFLAGAGLILDGMAADAWSEEIADVKSRGVSGAALDKALRQIIDEVKGGRERLRLRVLTALRDSGEEIDDDFGKSGNENGFLLPDAWGSA